MCVLYMKYDFNNVYDQIVTLSATVFAAKTLHCHSYIIPLLVSNVPCILTHNVGFKKRANG